MPASRLDLLTPADLPCPFGRYTLLSILGEGGMARVFDAGTGIGFTASGPRSGPRWSAKKAIQRLSSSGHWPRWRRQQGRMNLNRLSARRHRCQRWQLNKFRRQ